MTEEALTEKIDELITILLSPKVPQNKQLWTNKQCALYLGCSVSHFDQRISRRATFPKPLDLNNEGQRKNARWLSGRVMQWAEAHLLRGQPEDYDAARQKYQRAISEFEAMGSTGYVERLQDRIRDMDTAGE